MSVIDRRRPTGAASRATASTSCTDSCCSNRKARRASGTCSSRRKTRTTTCRCRRRRIGWSGPVRRWAQRNGFAVASHGRNPTDKRSGEGVRRSAPVWLGRTRRIERDSSRSASRGPAARLVAPSHRAGAPLNRSASQRRWTAVARLADGTPAAQDRATVMGLARLAVEDPGRDGLDISTMGRALRLGRDRSKCLAHFSPSLFVVAQFEQKVGHCRPSLGARGVIPTEGLFLRHQHLTNQLECCARIALCFDDHRQVVTTDRDARMVLT